MLETLLAAAIVLVLLLAAKNKHLKNERDSARVKNESDSKILYLQSRYASMGETVGNIAHQWKQPLNAIGSIQNRIKAALIFQGDISKEKLLESVETSFKLLQHLAETIDTFYSFLSQQNSARTSFLISDELETIRKITQYSFENSNIKLLFELYSNPTIIGNANEFTHAMLNLILNAKDALEETKPSFPSIHICITGGEKTCTITVADNAGGIRIEPIENIFEWHISSKETGSGTGLYMTKNIIEKRFGGTVNVENKGDGASFTIELPYAEYGEYFSAADETEQKLSAERIRQLTQKINELEELEKTFKKFAINHIQEAVFLINEKGEFDYVNDEACRSLGYARDDLLSMSLEDIDPDWPSERWSEQWKRLQAEKIAPIEARHLRRDRTTFPIEVSVNYFEHEGIGYTLAICRDITERLLIEERKNDERMRLFFERQLVGMAITSSQKGLLHVNDKLCEILGYPSEELIGTTWETMTHPEDLAANRIQFNRMANGEIEEYSLAKRYIRKDGRIVFTNLSVSCVRRADRSIDYVFALIEDITERVRAEESLQSVNETLEKRVLQRTAQLEEAVRTLNAKVTGRHQSDSSV